MSIREKLLMKKIKKREKVKKEMAQAQKQKVVVPATKVVSSK